MKIRFKNNPSGQGFSYPSGVVADVPNELGLKAIELDVADLIKEQVIERAVAQAPRETAVKKRKKK